jgi:hypothetical protein
MPECWNKLRRNGIASSLVLVKRNVIIEEVLARACFDIPDIPTGYNQDRFINVTMFDRYLVGIRGH